MTLCSGDKFYFDGFLKTYMIILSYMGEINTTTGKKFVNPPFKLILRQSKNGAAMNCAGACTLLGPHKSIFWRWRCVNKVTEIDYFRYFTAHPSLRQHRPAIGLQKWPEPIGLYTHRVENYEEQSICMYTLTWLELILSQRRRWCLRHISVIPKQHW